jgi:hypothetical protein
MVVLKMPLTVGFRILDSQWAFDGWGLRWYQPSPSESYNHAAAPVVFRTWQASISFPAGAYW